MSGLIIAETLRIVFTPCQQNNDLCRKIVRSYDQAYNSDMSCSCKMKTGQFQPMILALERNMKRAFCPGI